MPTEDPPLIDYDALAKAFHLSHGPQTRVEDLGRNQQGSLATDCRSVVAALRDQGLVVVRTEDLVNASGYITSGIIRNIYGDHHAAVALRDRLAALVAAPVSGEFGEGE